MISYAFRRILTLIPILFFISLVSFVVIELPPGDYVTFLIESRRASGIGISEAEINRLTIAAGLNYNAPVRYLNWMAGVLQGDFGYSMQWEQPVTKVLGDRVPLTMTIAFISLILAWIISTPIGIISAVKQYSWIDYVATFLSFVGIATPGFLIALLIAFSAFKYFGFSPLGLYSEEFIDAPWSIAKLWDLAKHMVIPLFVVGLTGTGVTIRVLRANLLDELKKQYVTTARAKGLTEYQVLMKYPVRMAINPLISTIGYVLPSLVSGEIVVSIVLSLQTTGPILLRAVLAQDLYLAAGIVLILSCLTVFGTLLSDLLLAYMDPRIRYGSSKK